MEPATCIEFAHIRLFEFSFEKVIWSHRGLTNTTMKINNSQLDLCSLHRIHLSEGFMQQQHLLREESTDVNLEILLLLTKLAQFFLHSWGKRLARKYQQLGQIIVLAISFYLLPANPIPFIPFLFYFSFPFPAFFRFSFLSKYHTFPFLHPPLLAPLKNGKGCYLQKYLLDTLLFSLLKTPGIRTFLESCKRLSELSLSCIPCTYR